jgi:hypothetical protein
MVNRYWYFVGLLAGWCLQKKKKKNGRVTSLKKVVDYSWQNTKSA